MADRFRLQRFVDAQDRGGTYDQALRELRDGRKRSHWMWFVFPQIAGLGRSPMAQEYAISGLDEARAYLEHPVLGARLRESARALLGHEGWSAEDILGGIDAMKLRSSMTLFARAAGGGDARAGGGSDARAAGGADARAGGGSDEPFQAVLDRYFGGAGDQATDDRL